MEGKTGRQPTKRRVNSEVVLAFSPESVHAPFLLRCGALFIDYLLIIFVPVGFLFLGRFFGEDGSNLIYGDLNNAGWLIAVVLAVANFVLLPASIGQSVGKLLAGIRIVDISGAQPSLKRIVLRQTVGYLLTSATLGLGFLLAAANRSGRSLHDLLAHTVVIQARKERVDK